MLPKSNVKPAVTFNVATIPALESAMTTWRIEWFLPKGRRRFWIRLGLRFDVTSEDLMSIEGYATYADQHPEAGQVPQFTPDELATVTSAATRMVTEAARRMLVPETSEMHPAYYLQVPVGKEFNREREFHSVGVRLFKTALIGREQDRVSCISVRVAENLPGPARHKGLQKAMEFAAILTLTHGKLFKLFYPKWPKRHKPIEFINQSTKVLYPPSSKQGEPWLDTAEIHNQAENVIAIMQTLDNEQLELFMQSLFAYQTAMEIFNSHPTLSVISFLASLSPLAKKEKCRGQLLCSIHGDIELKHDLVGERAGIVKAITQYIPLASKGKSRLNKLLIRLYGEQRSAFVHNAIMRHGEFGKQDPVTFPSETGPVSDYLQYREDLRMLRDISRWAILGWGASLADKTLPDSLKPPQPLDLAVKVSFEGSHRLPANTLVGLKLRPDESEVSELVDA